MATIELYTQPGCGFCVHAKQLLAKEGLEYIEYDIFKYPDRLDDMQRRTNNRTFPQIFINNRSIGGFNELRLIKQQGRL